MEAIQQGTVLHLPGINKDVLVLSRVYFNRTGMLIVCPVIKSAEEAALNIPIEIDEYSGYAILDQLRSIDIRARHYAVVGVIRFEQIQNISDAVQDIFDYYPYH